MANIIDIVIAAKDQASAPIQRIQSSLGGLNTVLGAISPGLAITGVASLGAAAAGAVLSVKALAKESEHLINAAQQTGTSVENIQVVGLLFEQAGLQAEDAALALKFLSKNISEANPLLAKLGVTSKDSYTALLQLADVFSKAEDGPNKIAIGLELLGRAGNIAIPVLNKGSDAFREMAEAGTRAGAIIGTDMVGNLTAADDAFDRLDLAVKGLRIEFALSFLPTISNVIEKLPRLIEHIKGAIGIITGKPLNAGSLVGPPAPPPGRTEKTALPGIGVSLADLREAVAWIAKLEAGRSAVEGLGARGFREIPRFKVDSVVDVPPAALDSKTAALEGFKTAMDDITEAGNVMSDSLHLAFNALELGFKGVFDSIVQGGRGFAAALRNVFRGLVDAILAELARLAAAAVFKFLLSFLPGGGTVAAVIPTGGGSLGVPHRTGAPLTDRATAGGNVYNISTLSPASVLGELLDPAGSFRRASLRVAELGAL